MFWTYMIFSDIIFSDIYDTAMHRFNSTKYVSSDALICHLTMHILWNLLVVLSLLIINFKLKYETFCYKNQMKI